MRHYLRSAIAVGASALLLGSGAGTAAAQGSLQFTLPFPISIPGLTAPLAPAGDETGAEGGTGAGTGAAPLATAADLIPADLADQAFEGSVIAAVNEARLAVGAGRLVTDPALMATAGERAAELAAGDPTVGEVTVPEDARPAGESASDRTTLELPAGTTPQKVLVALLADTGMRERMLSGDFARVGVGMATAADGTVHVVQDFERA